MVVINDTQTWTAVLSPYLIGLTPLTLIMLAWRARGFLDKLVNNHILHYKQDIIDAVNAGVAEEAAGRKEICEAVREGNERIVNTLLILKK